MDVTTRRTDHAARTGRAVAHIVAACAAVLALPVAFAACSHQPKEFDVGGPAPEAERLPAPGPVAADLTGAWEYDPRESDQPGAYRGGGGGGMGGMPGSTGGGDFPGSAGMPPRAGGYGGNGNGGGGRTGGGREGGGGRDSAFAGPARRMTIVQTDSTFALTRGTAPALTLFFDGRDVVVADALGNGAAQANGRWHGKRFEVRRTLPDGRTVLETFELTGGGAKLAVRTQIRGGERSEYTPPALRRVYDKVALPDSATQRTAPPPPPARIGSE